LLLSLTLSTAAQQSEQKQPSSADAARLTEQQYRQARVLAPGQAIEREMKGGESHVYRIKLAAGQFLRAVVEQKNTDVFVAIFGPNDKKLVAVDTLNRRQGLEPLFWIAEETGEYLLEVGWQTGGAASGRYQLKIEQIRAATDMDRKRIAAQSVFSKGFSIENMLSRKIPHVFEEALSLWKEVGETERQRLMLDAIGLCHSVFGDVQKALGCFNQALALHRAAKDRTAEIWTLNEIGVVYNKLGKPQRVLDASTESLRLIQLQGDNDLFARATALKNIGDARRNLGEFDLALTSYKRALEAYSSNGDQIGIAETHVNIAFTYYLLGDAGKSLEHLRSIDIPRTSIPGNTSSGAQSMFQELKFAEVVLIATDQLLFNDLLRDLSGQDELKAGQKIIIDSMTSGEGPKRFMSVISMLQAVGLESLAARGNYYLGFSYDKKGQKQKALEHYNQALRIFREINNPHFEAMALISVAASYKSLGEKQEALESYQKALLLYHTAEDLEGVGRALSGLMTTSESLNKPRLAILYGKQAVNAYQQIRANITNLERELQKSFLTSKEDTYRKLADLLIAEGRIPEAEQVLEMLKNEELFQFVRRDGKLADELKQRADLTAEERRTLEEYQKDANRLTSIGKRFLELDARRRSLSEDSPFPEQAEFDQLKQQLATARSAFEVFLRDLTDRFGKLDARVKEIESGLQKDLRKWGDKNAVVISTIVGEDHLNLIVTTPAAQEAHRVQVSRKELNSLVAQFRQIVIDVNYDPRPLGQKLYNLLLKPLEKDLSGAGAKTLIWSLDGTLRYLPVAALHDGKQYVAERYDNVVITLASRTGLGESPSDKARWRALGLGVSKEFSGFPALEAVPEELRAIIRETREGNTTEEGVLEGRRLLDEQFTKEAMDRALGRYTLVHVASHFSFRPGNEADSFLLLGNGGRLTLEDVKRATSLFDGVELLALSACSTATGSGRAGGEEVESFGVLAQEQGARAVLATLWPVRDESTRDLMVEFYRRYHSQKNVTKAEALRQAQLALLRGEDQGANAKDDARRSGDRTEEATNIKDMQWEEESTQGPEFKKDPQAPYSHPYYWAPFILIGNWR
jgi:CHAT domain-containing protein